MMTASTTLRFITLATCLILLLCCCSEPIPEPQLHPVKPTPPAAIQVSSLAPDLQRLYAMTPSSSYFCANYNIWFNDLLRIRDDGDKRLDAIPVLEKILKDEDFNGSTYQYAAAQALFSIGTPEAKRIIADWMKTLAYMWRHSVNFIYSFKMNPEKATAFMREFHLTGNDDDLEISIDTLAEQNESDTIKLRLSLKNTGKTAIIIDERWLSEKNVELVTNNGRIIHKFSNIIVCGVSMPNLLALKANESYSIELNLKPSKVDKTDKYLKHYLSDSTTMIASIDYHRFDIARPGTYNLYAILEVRPPSSAEYTNPNYLAHRKPFTRETTWAGRIISKPFSIQIQ
jgi:hypothetical protein